MVRWAIRWWTKTLNIVTLFKNSNLLPEPPPIRTEPDREDTLTELASVDSTNNYALRRVHAGLARNGIGVFAHEQTAGKGQRGKSWSSAPGESLSLSLILDPSPLQVRDQFQLSALVAVTVCDLLNQLVPADFNIKWPNDLYWQDRKAGGILIESVIGSFWKWAVIGIGLNINQSAFAQTVRNPVSLLMITGRTREPLVVARLLQQRLLIAWQDMQVSGFDPVYERFHTLLYKRDQPIRLRKDNRTFEAVLKGVTREGLLRVQHAIEEEFRVGEVEFVVGP